MASCAGCGAELPPKKAPGRARKWCSDRCRKVTLYAGECVDCGAPTNGYNGPGKASKRCIPCEDRRRHETRYWTQERVVAELRAWAADLGRSPTARESHETGRVPQWAADKEFGGWNAALRAAGLSTFAPGMYGRPGEDPEVIAETARLYLEGRSLHSVAELMDIAESTVYDRLRKAGVTTRGPAEAARLRWSRTEVAA